MIIDVSRITDTTFKSSSTTLANNVLTLVSMQKLASMLKLDSTCAQVRSGAWAGSSVPLASIVVTDQSGVEVKVLLWRRAAFWALTVFPGDILLITGTPGASSLELVAQS